MMRRAPQQAFALVLVLVLLSVALLVTLALSALTKIGHEAARANEHRVQARQNAILAMHAALGQLQTHAGPDAVLTGMAGAAGVQAGAGNRARHWGVIWSADRGFITWLVSGTNGSAIPDLTSGVILVSTASLGGDATDREHVRVIRLPLTARDSEGVEVETGGYAYWVGDEGVKLSIAIPDAQSAIQGSKHAIDNFFTSIPPTTANLLKLVAYEQVNFVGATTAQRQGGFHSFGLTHLGMSGSSLFAGMLNVNSSSVRYWTGVGATFIRNHPTLAASMTAANFGTDAAGLAGRPFRTPEDFLSALSPRLQSRGVSPSAFAAAMRPWLTARSDTFRIRAYGDSRLSNTAAAPAAVAYCEAIVQRTPEMMPDGSGRRFVITYFRWLTPADI